MRTVLLASLAVLAACDPRRPHIRVSPETVCAGETVVVSWRADDDRPGHPSGTPIRILADRPTTPSLGSEESNGWRDPRGVLEVMVTESTTFMAVVPGGASNDPREPGSRVTVRTGGTTNFLAHFTGECRDGAPPYYAPRTLSGFGRIARVVSNAEVPVQVIHAGESFPVPPGAGIGFPTPILPVAGDYTIIPSLPITMRCVNSAGMPIAPPPPIELVVTGDCGR
jgi:hypothetical protein